MIKISAVIITKNEEQNLKNCLGSLDWVNEIVVVDSGSIDRTLQIAEEFRTKIIQTEWLGFGKTKQLAVEQASNDWVFSIDADEVVTPELKERILKLLENEMQIPGYRIRRSSFYLQKLIRHSGWDTDYPKRLFNRKSGKFSDDMVHESVQVEGKMGIIEEPLLHFTYPTIESHIRKMNRYTTIAAEAMFAKGKKVSIFGALVRAKLKFLKMYIIRAGFLDGWAGLILALNSAYGVFLKYLKLWKLNH